MSCVGAVNYLTVTFLKTDACETFEKCQSRSSTSEFKRLQVVLFFSFISLPSFFTMVSSSTFDYREYYTDHIIPLLAASPSFLGNCDYGKDFYCTVQRQDHLGNHTYIDSKTEQEMSFLVIGEVAGLHRGTKLNAQGNHYAGKAGEPVRVFSTFIQHTFINPPEQPTPIKDKSSAKDILKLVEPMTATDDLKALFGNQVVPLNEVLLADKERDRLNNLVSSQVPLNPTNADDIASTLFLFKNVLIPWAFTEMSTSSPCNFQKNSECV